MALVLVLWWVVGVWLVVGGLLLLLCLAVDLFGTPSRTWSERLLDFARHLPFFLLVAVGWPVAIVIAFFQVRRDVILETACYGTAPLLKVPPITEMQWQRGGDAVRLLGGLPMTISPRKRRLFACACCRRIWDRLADERSRDAVELAERLADGRANPDEVRQSNNQAGAAASTLLNQGDLEAMAAAKACQDCLNGDGLQAAHRASVSRYRRRRQERRAQCELLREIVGNPFQPLPARPFPPEVMELARAIHEGDHALYPLLADALEELGEAAAADHCRGARHVRGCHVVDWVLGWR
jgi:hypothetical protein